MVRSDHWARKKSEWQQQQAEADAAYQSGGLFASLGSKPINRSARVLTQTQSLPPYQPTQQKQVRWNDHATSQSFSVPSTSFLPPINQPAPSTAPSQMQCLSPRLAYQQHDANHYHTHQSQPHAYMSSLNELKGGPSQSELAKKREAMLLYQRELAAQMAEKQARVDREKLERLTREAAQEAEERAFNPFGRGGAGAPMRDASGHVVTDHNPSHVSNIVTSAAIDPAAARREAQRELQQSLAAQIAEKKQREAQNKFRLKNQEDEEERRFNMGQAVTSHEPIPHSLPAINNPMTFNHVAPVQHHASSSLSHPQIEMPITSMQPAFAMQQPSHQSIATTLHQPRVIDRNREYVEMVAEMERLQNEIVAESERIRMGREQRGHQRNQLPNPVQPIFQPINHTINRASDLHDLVDSDMPDLNVMSHASLLMPLGSTFSQDLAGNQELSGSSEFVRAEDPVFDHPINEDYSSDVFHDEEPLAQSQMTEERRPRRKWNDGG